MYRLRYATILLTIILYITAHTVETQQSVSTTITTSTISTAAAASTTVATTIPTATHTTQLHNKSAVPIPTSSTFFRTTALNTSLPGKYHANVQQSALGKSPVHSKGLKLPLIIPKLQRQQQQQQQQQNAMLSITQTLQKPFQNWFSIFNRNQAAAPSTSSSSSSTMPSTTTPNTTLYTCSCRCGERNDESRIVGGSITGVSEYPWMARLSYFNRFYCGGTLINDRYVLSAAHCIKGFMWFMIKVTFGEHDRCKDKERPETRFVLRAFTQKFSFSNFDNDIALLRLNDRVPITSFIRPICLPRITERDNLFVGIKAIATGWGTLKEDGKPSCLLQEVTVPVLDNHVCVVQTNYTQKMITKNMLCAGYPGKGEKDSCQGDSGGPLVRIRSDDKRYEQIGIVSWGNGCARPNYPGVYTRITKYLDWIIENSKDGCFCEGHI